MSIDNMLILCRSRVEILVQESHIYRGMVLHSAWVRTSIDLAGSRVLLVTKVQVDVEGIST